MRTTPINRMIDHLRRAVPQLDGAGRGDGELIDSFIESHDEAAFAILVKRHGPMVWGVCRRLLHQHDAEDAFQATFLVLARKAASIRSKETVANWLYGVAHQTALHARRTAARRRAKEVQVTKMPDTESVEPDVWADLQPVLDEELSRLPDIYRAVIVHCDLEGLTRKEVARRLGVPEGTVAGRLARARTMLAKRLTQRGVTLSGGMLATILAQNVASAGVPAMVVSNTIKSASLLATGQAVAGVISVKVLTLTEGVLQTMYLMKLKTATMGLLLFTLICGVAGAIFQTQAAEPPKDVQKHKASSDMDTAQQVAPPEAAEKKGPLKATPQRQYVIKSRLMELEADLDRRKEVHHLPKLTLDDGQLAPMHIMDGPQNLLPKAVEEENIKIGTLLAVRAKHLGEGKVRLFFSFQRNEVEKSNGSEIRVRSNSVQTVRVIDLRQLYSEKGRQVEEFIVQTDAAGSPRQVVEITVDEIRTDGQTALPPAILPPPAVGPQPKGGKK